MDRVADALITIGALLLVSLLIDALGRRTRLPRVSLLLVLGVVAGPAGLNLLPAESEALYVVIAHIALVMVGFLLGGEFTRASLREHGRLVFWISIAEVLGTALVVLVGLLAIGVRPEIALLLAGIAPATDPAAVADVVREARSEGKFTRTLLSVVAIDDAWGLVLFSLMLAIASGLSGAATGFEILLLGAWDVGGAILLGIGIGVPMAYATGRIQPGEPTLAEALGVVFLCGGMAIWLDVSFLLAAMVTGGVVANLAKHHTRPFRAIENIEGPFMVLFFVLAGASFRLEWIPHVAAAGAAYVLLRVAGRLIGAWFGGSAGGADALTKRWMGFALMPQAGVALGMALVTSQRLPEAAAVVLPVVIGATVLFEVTGPVATRLALQRVGDLPERAL